MPIRFRCSYCNRLLGIATRKAGTETTCPHCGYTITVPVPEQADDGRTERMNLDEVGELLGMGPTEAVPKSAVAEAPAPPAAAPSPPVVEKPRTEPPRPQPTAPKVVPAPVASAPPIPTPVPKGRSTPAEPKPPRASGDDPPLFEGDVDELLGVTAAPEEPERDKPAKVSGMDAMSLGEPAHQIVISAQKATFLMILVVVLMALSFAAGMLVKG